jgi:hypothetical protein
MAERPQRRESRQGNENETAFFSFFMFLRPGGPVKRIGDGTGRAIGVFGRKGRERNGGTFLTLAQADRLFVVCLLP